MTSLQHSPLCVQLCSSAALTALSTRFQAWNPLCACAVFTFTDQPLLQSPGLFLDYKAAVPIPAGSPAVGYAARGSASGCTHSARGSGLVCSLLGQTLSWVAGNYLCFCVQESLPFCWWDGTSGDALIGTQQPVPSSPPLRGLQQLQQQQGPK